jgi:hypothetical protein
MIAVYLDTEPQNTCDAIGCEALALLILEQPVGGGMVHTLNSCVPHVKSGVDALVRQTANVVAQN